MIKLRWDSNCRPAYRTRFSSGCDVVAREMVRIPRGCARIVPLGVWIDSYSIPYPAAGIPELQLRLRSSLALQGLVIPNGVGTIDADYPGEIGLILHNTRATHYTVEEGSRVGQLVQVVTHRIRDVDVLDITRGGGYGSTEV